MMLVSFHMDLDCRFKIFNERGLKGYKCYKSQLTHLQYLMFFDGDNVSRLAFEQSALAIARPQVSIQYVHESN